ncbi:MAG: hemolysin [Thalassobius sp.]|nr:hemolysin [Thalassovita sp.]
MDQNILLVIISLIFSGFFSAIEIAFISANRLHLELLRKKNTLAGRIVAKFVDRPSYFISTTLLGNTVALVVYGYYFALILEPSLEALLHSSFPLLSENTLLTLVLILQTILSTLLVLATAEFLPKSLSLINPDDFLTAAAIPMNIIYKLLYPIVFVIDWLSKQLIAKLFKLEYKEVKPAFGLTDLNIYIERVNNVIAGNESEADGNPEVNKEIFSNALEFKKIKVRDCMIPRKEIVAIEYEDDIEELSDAFTSSGHSKIPVYKKSIDNIVGYCHHLELFKKPQSIASIMTDIIIVPETMLANELMVRFISERKSIALVVDEFGGTSGIVTIEDIIEEIFGEIEDEYDDLEGYKVKRLDDNNFLLNARNEVDRLNQEFNWQIPEGDYETLGGFILYLHGDIPEIGDQIDAGHLLFTIKSMEDARIDMVQLTVIDREKSN